MPPAAQVHTGDPRDPDVTMGPLSGMTQFEKVRRLIKAGIEEAPPSSAAAPMHRATKAIS